MRVAMIGPALESAGGVSMVARSIVGAPELGDVAITYFASVGPGGALGRLWSSARGQAAFLRSVGRGWRPDLVHIHLGSPLVAGGAPHRFTSVWRKALYLRESAWLGRPTVLHLHGSDGFVQLHDSSSRGARLAESLLRSAAAVVVLSREMQERVRAWTDDAVAVHRVLNPVDVSAFGPVPEVRRPVVLFMGALHEGKGVHDLLEVVPEVLRWVPDARFRFGGVGDHERLEERARALGVAHRVELLGWIEGEAKHRAYREAAVFCLPSYYEGLPVAMLEAMAAGLPVVASRVAAIPEIISEGQTGHLHVPGDRAALAQHLVQLLTREGMARQMGRQGRRVAERSFDRVVVSQDLRRLWEGVLAR